ncbi:hypothetical protein BDN72DRAFT_780304, partial [Pluteus cervinus]
MDNKFGKCRARFPRQLVEETHVDEDSHGLILKKKEAWINTVTPVLTYLCRCNTDVSSLKSGTAAEGIIRYATDYITKGYLKTRVIFDTMRSMFAKHHAYLSGDASSQDKARSIMTKIVNGLTSKMEIGSPMASLYLLGNPDHYTSHTFTYIYWQRYVQEILGLSPVNDYIFRPKELEHLNLYEFISQCERISIIDKDREEQDQDAEDAKEKVRFEVEICKADLEINEMDSQNPANPAASNYRFLSGHPFAHSQVLRLRPPAKHTVPNFVGATLPRKDKNTEYYSKTMLTLFKPWRTGKHLKMADDTWEDAFATHRFTKHQKLLLKNLHIRYECMDANDDFYAQLKAGGTTLPS